MSFRFYTVCFYCMQRGSDISIFINNTTKWSSRLEWRFEIQKSYRIWKFLYCNLLLFHLSNHRWKNIIYHFVGNKAKRWVSKRVFQENKACQIFQKTNISYPPIRTRIKNVFKNISWPTIICKLSGSSEMLFCCQGHYRFCRKSRNDAHNRGEGVMLFASLWRTEYENR